MTSRALALLPALLAAQLFAAAPAPAQDIPPIGRIPEITEGLVDTAIAYAIGERCEKLRGRRIEGLAFLWSLAGVAMSRGFSPAEIEAYIDDDAERDRIEALARERLIAKGAVEGEGATFCAIGRAEMQAGSRIGRLLAEE
jgi:hypothetical protein